MILPTDVIEIGTLRKPHGTRGEVQCALINDYLDSVEPDFLILEIDHILVPFYLEEYRYKNDDTVLFLFEDITTEQRASRLCGCRVFLLKSLLPELDGAEPSLQTMIGSQYGEEALLGYEVVDAKSGSLGTITAVDTATLNTLFFLSSGHIIPAHDDFLTAIDTEKRILQVALPEGLL